MARASIPAQARSIKIISCSLEAAVTVDDACGASSAVVVGNSGQIHRRYFRSARSNVKSEVFDHDDRVETATAKGEVQLHDWMYLRPRSCQQRIHVRPSPANMLSAIPENLTQWRWQLGGLRHHGADRSNGDTRRCSCLSRTRGARQSNTSGDPAPQKKSTVHPLLLR